MQTHTTLDPQDPSLELGATASGMIVPGLIMAAIGGVVAYACGSRVEYAPSLFYHAYLVAFVFYLSITLGALFFVLLHHLARSGWSATLRRLAEGLSANIFLLAVLFVPIGLQLDKIYTWADPVAAAAEKAAEKNEKAGKTEAQADAKESVAKTETGAAAAKEETINPIYAENTMGATIGHDYWLTRDRFLGRFVIYFLIWGFLVWYLRGHSILQDKSGSVALSRKMERISAPGMILFAVTITLATIDLIMSLNAHWFSTMIGVYMFADAVLSSLVAITLLSLALQTCGRLRGVVTVEHYHDLGKLTFGFIIFWAYIAFSQYMLIWYANIPEETQFYIPRQIGAWAAVSLTLIIVHFVLPFFGLMSRNVKRLLPVHAFWLIWILVAHAFDIFWLIMPNCYIHQLNVAKPGEPLPEIFKTLLESHQSIYQLSPHDQSFMAYINAPLTPMAIATVLGMLAFMGGLYLANTAWLLGRAPLVPLKDPRLNEALAFQNT